MGKLITFMLMLLFADLLLLITGQINNTLNSLILSSMLDFSNFTLSSLWSNLISSVSNNALAWIAGAAATVATGFLISTTDTKLFIPAAMILGSMVTDFITFYNTMISAGVNIILATLIIAPIIVSFTMVLIEWARGRD